MGVPFYRDWNARHMLDRAWPRSRWLALQIVEQFFSQGCLKNAAALTYTTLFAIVPFMTVAHAIWSLLPESSGLELQIQVFIFDNFLPETSAVVQERLSEFMQQARKLTAAGLAILFVTAFMTLVTIEETFNAIWQVPEPRRGLQRFFTYWTVMTFGPALILAGILISTYLFSLPLVVDIDAWGLREVLLGGLPVVLETAGFTVLFYAMPNCSVPFRHALLGGLVTTLLFELCKILFGWFVAGSNTTLIYGAFAAVPLFLLSIYLIWAIVLSGAIFVRTLSLHPEPEASSEPPLIKCLMVLSHLQRAHAEGQGVTESELADALALSRNEQERIFAVLNDMKLAHHVEGGGLALGRSLKSVTLWDLYERLPERLDRSGLKHLRPSSAARKLEEFIAEGSTRLGVDLDELLEEIPPAEERRN